MMIYSFPPGHASASLSHLLVKRVYRLVDGQGNLHPILDDHYETHEAAWAEAVCWWHLQNPSSQDAIGIGVEVSTANGEWRTIRHPCS
jgi:hypothetical protein